MNENDSKERVKLPWRATGAVYLLTLLGALAAGLWPEAIVPPREPTAAPLPALQALAVGQLAFILLIYPLALLRRQTSGERQSIRAMAGESAMMMLATAPFYFIATYLSDATAVDVARVVTAAAIVWPAAWAVGLAFATAKPAGVTVILLALLAATLGLLWAYYLALEFTASPSAAQAFRHFSPILNVWDIAASRPPHGTAQGLVFLAVETVAAVASLLAVGKKVSPC